VHFPFELCIPSYSGRSGGVHFLRRFLCELPFFRFKLFKSFRLLYFRNLDDVTNTVARCQCVLFFLCVVIIVFFLIVVFTYSAV